MEKNDQNSCTSNYRYIHIRYFFVRDKYDKYDKREIELGYWTDVSTLDTTTTNEKCKDVLTDDSKIKECVGKVVRFDWHWSWTDRRVQTCKNCIITTRTFKTDPKEEIKRKKEKLE